MRYNRLRGVEQFGYLTLEYPPRMSMRFLSRNKGFWGRSVVHAVLPR